eukprot:maker-scaffold_32-snap-gene-0.2-mRNA-1 protein AED:0.05 eAED:0.16 QI:0/0/0.5/1/1/1/2/1584/76
MEHQVTKNLSQGDLEVNSITNKEKERASPFNLKYSVHIPNYQIIKDSKGIKYATFLIEITTSNPNRTWKNKKISRI